MLGDGRDFQRELGAAQWGIEPDVTVRVTPHEAAKLIELRQAMEVVRDTPAGAGSVSDLRDADPQLAAAFLVARLQLLGRK